MYNDELCIKYVSATSSTSWGWLYKNKYGFSKLWKSPLMFDCKVLIIEYSDFI